MRMLLSFAAKVDRLNRTFAQVVRWALLANALLITVNAFGRTFFRWLGRMHRTCSIISLLRSSC